MKRFMLAIEAGAVFAMTFSFVACAGDGDGSIVVNSDRSTNVAVNSSINAGVDLGEGADKNLVKGNGEMRTEARELGKMKSLKMSGAFDVVLGKGDKAGLKITCDSNILPHVTSKLADGELSIGTDAPISCKGMIRVELATPEEVVKVEQAGACKFIMKDMSSARFQLILTGTSTAEISGKTDLFEVNIQGACSLDARTFKSKEASVSVSGAGKADISVDEKLTAKITGLGTINYYGEPKDIVKNIAGLGSLNKK